MRTLRRVQDGQAMMLVLLALCLLLAGGLAFSVDAANLWFHRQAAQTAADAACTAGAMDLYTDQMDGSTTKGGFTAGTGFDCSTTGMSSASICKYASFNGYNGAGLVSGAASNNVAVTFPASDTVSGLAACPVTGTAACVPSSVTYPFLQVSVTDQVPTVFDQIFGGGSTSDVGAHALCGVVSVMSPLPLVVLHPTATDSFSVTGAAILSILGGPTNSIQVDSDNATAAYFQSISSKVNLSAGGPDGTGSDFSVVGGPTAKPSSLSVGTTGKYVQPASNFSDPFADLPAPAVPGYPSVPPNSNCSNKANPCYVAYHVNGCPDTNGCMDYGPGLYDGTNGTNNEVPIQSTMNVSYSPYYVHTAIFDPGLYYIKNSSGGGDILIDSSSVVRPSTAGDGSGGTMFYLSGPSTNCCGSVIVSGATSGVDAFVTAGGTHNPPLQCPGAPALSPTPPTTLSGNVLLGVCSGTYADPSGQSRGMLFFSDHNNTSTSTDAQPAFAGSTQTEVAGVLYFHSTSNSQVLTISGASSGGSYAFSAVVVDELLIDGSGTLNMQLSPYGFGSLKAALIQ